MINTPIKIQTAQQNTAAIRLCIPRADIQKVMGPAIQELMTTLATQGIAPAGPLCSLHFRIDPAVFDFEICIAIARPIQAMGRVINSTLPAATVMRTQYRGPYEGLGTAWAQFRAAIGNNADCAQSSLWECYVQGPESSPDPSQWLTELNLPLAH